jgi:hypothetical protein
MSAATREQAKQYLATHKIPQMFESLLSCLMIEKNNLIFNEMMMMSALH